MKVPIEVSELSAGKFRAYAVWEDTYMCEVADTKEEATRRAASALKSLLQAGVDACEEWEEAYDD